jgi:hypothetical protein
LIKRFPACYGRIVLISYRFAKSVYIRFIIKIENSRYKIETFLEIHKRFRWDQILILAEENDVFKMFEESVSRRAGPGMVDLEMIKIKTLDLGITEG